MQPTNTRPSKQLPTNHSLKWTLEEYKYDQLNRIVESQTLLPHATTLNSYLTTMTNKARTSYTYDKNGNILKLNRSSYTAAAPTTAALMDSLTYIYPVNAATGKLTNNKLYHVNDLQTNKTAFTEDIDDQGVLGAQLAGANYDYDAIGQLTKDNAENIDSIRWNVYGKIEKIFFKNGKPAMEFLYDAAGNRIAKLLKNAKHPVPAGKDSTYDATYYWRDAQGNVLATESKRFYPIPGTFTGSTPLGGWQGHAVDVEYAIYGSSRLGTYQDTIRYDITTPGVYGQYVRYSARRQYELSNHLGNVMATLSDVKTYAAGTKGAVGYLARVLTAQQFYPFGMQMPGKNVTLASYSSLNRYRFSFNGQERETEINTSVTSAEFWVYDGRLGRRWNVDPVLKPWKSSYDAFSNNPIIKVDPNGDDDYYSESGNFVGSDDKSTNYKRVLNNSTVEKIQQLYLQVQEKGMSLSYLNLKNNLLQTAGNSVCILDVNESIQKNIYKAFFTKPVQDLLDGILESEGGYVDLNTDPGGKTNYGIAENREWKPAAQLFGIDNNADNIAKISSLQAQFYYFKTRIEKYRINDINSSRAQNAILDQSVLTPAIVNKSVKTTLNNLAGTTYSIDAKKLTDDQINTLNTLDADEFTEEFKTQQLNYYESLSGSKVYNANIKGWKNRLDKL
ncbi:MAG: hypothetical protein IPM95_00105 [Sphingobacteriales bacterium]|nr:hypothetical protein [Sphingobacteriales bacterium]